MLLALGLGPRFAQGPSPSLHDNLRLRPAAPDNRTASPAFRRRTGGLDGERLQRVPRGFPPDHPAAEYLKYRQFLAGREYPARLATGPRFYATLLALFREIAPLIVFLNEPLVAAPRDPLRP